MNYAFFIYRRFQNLLYQYESSAPDGNYAL